MKMLKRIKIGISFVKTTTRLASCSGFFVFIALMLSIPLDSKSQSKWSNYIGIYFTGDAPMYYTGPSVLLGTDFRVRNNLSVGFYGQYFEKDFSDHGFQAWTLAALGQLNIGKRKKLYTAIGIAWQRAIENDDSNFDAVDRSIILPAYRLGHNFLFKRFVISPEINLTGPYSYNNGSSIELFTQSSLGLRLHLLTKSHGNPKDFH